jgi:hypothetical protein
VVATTRDWPPSAWRTQPRLGNLTAGNEDPGEAYDVPLMLYSVGSARCGPGDRPAGRRPVGALSQRAHRGWREAALPVYPSTEDSRGRLHRAGWTVGEVSTAGGQVLVTGTNGENVLSATGGTADEAWHRECGQAAAVGMLAPPRGAGAGGTDE